MDRESILRDQLSLLAFELHELSISCARYRAGCVIDLENLNQMTTRHLYLTARAKTLLQEYSTDNERLQSLVELRLFEHDLDQVLHRGKISKADE